MIQEATSILQALDFLVEEDEAASRKYFMGKRYLVEKVQRALLAGGFGKVFVKRAAALIHSGEQGENAEFETAAFLKCKAAPFDKFEPHDLGVPGEGSEVANMALANMFPSYVTECQAGIDKKVKDLQKTMHKKDWKAAMAKLDTCLAVPAGFEGDEVGLQTTAGAEPWVVCYKKYCWRYGPQDFPLPGCSCFVFALNSPLVVNLFAAEGVVAEGLAVADLKAFLDSPSGGGDFYPRRKPRR